MEAMRVVPEDGHRPSAVPQGWIRLAANGRGQRVKASSRGPSASQRHRREELPTTVAQEPYSGSASVVLSVGLPRV